MFINLHVHEHEGLNNLRVTKSAGIKYVATPTHYSWSVYQVPVNPGTNIAMSLSKINWLFASSNPFKNKANCSINESLYL